MTEYYIIFNNILQYTIVLVSYYIKATKITEHPERRSRAVPPIFPPTLWNGYGF